METNVIGKNTATWHRDKIAGYCIRTKLSIYKPNSYLTIVYTENYDTTWFVRYSSYTDIYNELAVELHHLAEIEKLCDLIAAGEI